MTVVAAAIDPDTQAVWMAADAGGYSDGGTRSDGSGKVMRLNTADGRPLLLGFAGLAAVKHLVRRRLKVEAAPAANQPLDDWADRLAEQIAELAVDAKPPLLGQDGFVDASGLLAFRGQIWEVNQQEAAPVSSGYTAIGSGAQVALGYLMATRDSRSGEFIGGAELAVSEAVEAACRWNTGCWVGPNGPQVERLDP